MTDHKVLVRNGYMLKKSKLTKKEILNIIKDLTVTPLVNTNYSTAAESHKVYFETDEYITVPRYYGEERFGKATSDEKVKGVSINITFKGTIRENQKIIVESCYNDILNKGGGVIVLPCGEGKTVDAIILACKLGLKPLVIVHKTFLQNQWYKRISQFTDAKIGLIRQKKIDVKGKDIVIGMLQSIALIDYDPEIFNDFGMVIFDECFPGYERVITDSGSMTFDEIYKLFENRQKLPLVLSFNERGNFFEYKEITFCWKKQADELINVIVNKRKITCTPNHKFLTFRGYVQAKDLLCSDVLKGIYEGMGFQEYGELTIKIERVELNEYNKIVYDIEVKDNHNFIIANSEHDLTGPIVHNCHHSPAKVFCNALAKTCSKYTIGLSATPYRKDGLIKVMFWYLGDIIYKMERKGDKRVQVKIFNYISNDPLFKEKKTWFNGKTNPNVPKMITNMYKIKDRNTFIVNIIDKLKCHYDKKILVLSHRLDHLSILKDAVDDLIKKQEQDGIIEIDEYTTSKYIGGMKEMSLNDAAEADIIFATYAMAEEGLDIDGLNTLILATPKADIIQSIGRIMRKPIQEGDVFPLIIDIMDGFSVFINWSEVRKNYYNKNGYDICEYEVFNDKCITVKQMLYYNKKISTKIYKKEDADIYKEYVCFKYGKDRYEMELECGIEESDKQKILYDPDLDVILKDNYDPDLVQENNKVINDDIINDDDNVIVRARRMRENNNK